MKEGAAFNAVLILKLFWLHSNILLEPIYEKCSEFANVYAKVDDRIDVMTDMTSKIYSGVENINLEFEETFKESCSLLSTDQSI